MNTQSIGKEKNGLLAGICLLTAALILLICSQCSPLYPINVWVDPNCLLTVGRAMKEGSVVYRDIYEQKGPTLYLIHYLAALISDKSFFGVYVMEVLSLAASLWAACRMMAGRVKKAWKIPGVLLLAAGLIVSKAFVCGDSAEEFCLPLILGTMAIAFHEYGEKKGPMRPKMLFVCGLMAGLTATIKYTLLGAFMGFCLVEGILALKEGGFVRALRSAGVFLAGMLLPLVLWALYFAANGALGDFIEVYFYNNIMIYTEANVPLSEILAMTKEIIRGNWPWLLLAAGGMLVFLFRRSENLSLRLCMLAMAAGQFVTVFLFGHVWTYSVMALGAFAALGILEAGRFASKHVHLSRKTGIAALAVFAGVLLLFTWVKTPNRYLRGKKLENIAQGYLASFMEPGASLLQYSHLDDGFYLASGTIPQEKYFVRLNIPLPEMKEELDRYLEEGIPDYVVVGWNALPEQFDRYELVEAAMGYREDGRLMKNLFLYRRKAE